MRNRNLNQIPRKNLLIVALALSASFAAPTAGLANKSQKSFVRDDTHIVFSGDVTREFTLDQFKALGGQTLQIFVTWYKVAPNGKSKPSGFNGSDPADYPASSWAPYDEAIKDAKARGFEIMLNVTGAGPAWAAKSYSRPGIKQPNVSEYKKFATAVATRYSGSYDAGSGALPKADIFGSWNEPNFPAWLYPQAKSSKVGRIPASPQIYRELYTAATSAIRSVGAHKKTPIYAGETAPRGATSISASKAITPVVFWREFFCLDANYRKFRGAAAKARGCKGRVKIDMQGASHHPYAGAGDVRPTFPARSALDIPISKMGRLASVLNKAARRKVIKRNIPIYNTEFGYQTNPPDKISGVSLSNAAEWINQSEYMSYRVNRVKSYNQYQLIDDPLLNEPGTRKYSSWQSGLLFTDLGQKPSYNAFRLPIWVIRKGAKKVTVWGGVRPKERPTSVNVQAASGSSFDTVATVNVGSTAGYFQRNISKSKAAKLKWRLQWADRDGNTFTSRTAKASK